MILINEQRFSYFTGQCKTLYKTYIEQFVYILSWSKENDDATLTKFEVTNQTIGLLGVVYVGNLNILKSEHMLQSLI